MKSSSSVSSVFSVPLLTRRLALVGVTLASTLLTACYVVPVNRNPPVTTVYVTPPAPAPSSMTFSARLYPANDLATAYGVVNAVVTNDLNGRGVFTTNINGETFNGEATRVGGGSARTGVANGAGNRGGYINCNYQMNTATLGTGQCKLSNGALFTMHVGS
ncbi:MAG: hypothetical protein V4772_02480 [Pseudomonadota bacterium]